MPSLDLVTELRMNGITVQRHGDSLAVDFPPLFSEIYEFTELIKDNKAELLELLSHPGYYRESACRCRHFLGGQVGNGRCQVCGLELKCPACQGCRACRLKLWKLSNNYVSYRDFRPAGYQETGAEGSGLGLAFMSDSSSPNSVNGWPCLILNNVKYAPGYIMSLVRATQVRHLAQSERHNT